MLSIKAIKQGQDNSYYFEKDNNYYFKEDQEHLIKAFEWGGKGAIDQALIGQVTPEDFERVMADILSTGQQLGKKNGNEILHRPGFDLTFSAPKSVSILALAGGDDRLLALHQQSVVSAMAVVERLAQARVKQGGEMIYETTRHLTFAQFMHDTSREGDPQLHTHVVVANMTLCADGLWRSLASDMSRKNGFYERVMNDRNYFGIIYRAELAKGLTDMGFQLKMVGKDGLFEIEGVPPDVLKLFSKRREQIEEAVKTWGSGSVKAYDLAALNTRKSKTAVNRQTLMNQWKGDLDETQWDLNHFLHQIAETKSLEENSTIEAIHSKNSGMTQGETSELDKAREFVMDAVTVLSQRVLSMDYNQILTQATEYGLGKCRSADLVNAFDKVVKEGVLIRLDETGSRWTTKQGLEIEVALMDAVKEGKAKKMGLVLEESLLMKRGLNDFDKQFVKDLLGNHERISVLQCSPEKKHEWLEQLLHVVEDHGKTVKILSPNAVHAQEVNEKVTRNPQSLWAWLKNIGKESVSGTVAGFNFQTERYLNLPIYITRLKNGVVVVDGAQKISSDALNKLFEVTNKLQTKVILLHEMLGQQQSFKGDVMRTLQKANVHRVERNNQLESKALPIHLHVVEDDKERLKVSFR